MLNFSHKRNAVKTAMRYCYSPIKLAKSRSLTICSIGTARGNGQYHSLPMRIFKWNNLYGGEFGSI